MRTGGGGALALRPVPPGGRMSTPVPVWVSSVAGSAGAAGADAAGAGAGAASLAGASGVALATVVAAPVSEGASASAPNSYFYVVGGTDTPTGTPAEGPGTLLVTGGQSNSTASWTWFRFDEQSTTQFQFTDGTDPLYTAGASEICFDLPADSSGNATLLFWATGANGADCQDMATLTEATALYDSATDVDTGSMWAAALANTELWFKTNNATATLERAVLYRDPAVSR